jgi:hypothetical protein
VIQIYDWVIGRAPITGPAWFDEFIEYLYSLKHFPERCPLAREAKKARRDIRCLLFGKGRRAFRILYEVNEVSHTVFVLHVRRGALRDLDL